MLRILLVALLLPLAAHAQLRAAHAQEATAQEGQPTISVSATGTATVTPDMAIVRLAVVREAETAHAALDSSNAATSAVLRALEEAGIAARDVQTSGLNIRPRYASQALPEDEPRIAGYTVTNGVTVRVRELARLGEILDRAVTLGVNSGGDIAFTNADTDAPEAEARRDAVARATAQARTLAEAAGVSLGPVLSIRENGGDAPFPRPMAMESRARVPIAAGETEYSVSVSMRWAIEGDDPPDR